MADLAPEQLAKEKPATTQTMEEAAQTEDVGSQPDPAEFEAQESDFEATAAELGSVKWPADDKDAPDYAYLAAEAASATFTLTPAVLEALMALNRYVPSRDKNVIAFALRGARLVTGDEAEMADAVELENVRPDHRTFRCSIGLYFTDSKKISVYKGSTVPCRGAFFSSQDKNMLPAGMHTYFVWRHKGLRPALRLGTSEADPETGAFATVIRNRHDFSMTTRDVFDRSQPLDNVHCSYFLSESPRLGSFFSSWGCLTIRGEDTPSQQWRKFQAKIGELASKTRVDLMLATGKDAAMVAAANGDMAVLSPKMTALRAGSRGADVERLQAKLNIPVTGFYGAETLDAFTTEQRRFNDAAGRGKVADGVFTTAVDAAMGWRVFTPAPAPAPAPVTS